MKKIFLFFALSLLAGGCSIRLPLGVPPEDMDTPEDLEYVPAVIEDGRALSIAESVANQVTNSPTTTHAGTYQGFIWWISNDGFNVSINYTPSVSIPIKAPSVTDFEPTFQKIVTDVDTAFSQKGFSINKKNSSEKLGDQTFYDYIRAYENLKIGIVCILELNGDAYVFPLESLPTVDADFTLNCTSKFQRSYNEQVPLLKGLKDRKNLVISSIGKMIGDFVQVGVNARRTGNQVVLKKQNGIYYQVYSGQESPACAVVDKYKVPKEIYEECYLPDNSTIRH